MFFKLKLIIRTALYMKSIQIYSRFFRRFKRINTKSVFALNLRNTSSIWIRKELIASSFIDVETFCFLNEDGIIGSWNDMDKSKLWLYNLHYFDDLNSFEASKRSHFHCDLIDRWIDENPPLFGNGWEPYPQSLRIVNWVKYFLSFGPHSEKVLESLYLQVHVLSQDLEYHLLGNHLFANAKAMVFAGCYFKGDKSEGWLNLGLKILDQQIPEQIFRDGGNFELSPMYHNIILADMLDLYNLAQTYRIPELDQRKNKWKFIIEKMLYWSRTMSHPDGEVSFFNDSAIGIAARTDKLFEYACQLGIEESSHLSNNCLMKLNYTYLNDSGYVVVESEKIKAILDLAKIGPDYIPGHGHADTLGFELSLFGQRVFVNSGTGEYGLSKERLRQRKTAAHNTIEVDGEDSSEVWSGFRVARRAYPSKPVINQSDQSISISCSHNGYHRLSGKVTHKRHWDFNQKVITITDQLLGNFQKATAHYHLHPGIDVCQSDSGIVLTLKCGKQIILEANAEMRVIDTTWHPEFGIVKANKKLVILLNQSNLVVTLRY
ncbi:heparinase II/III family protein [Photobacterium leiognathi]|uniref:heparinase II/III family protein n=1 Tax=Photobacterium leiognathi TaxID=553611 RepID=UPI00273779D2|nr:alginate lyase family protein [Photobacterium leiognathi]